MDAQAMRRGRAPSKNRGPLAYFNDMPDPRGQNKLHPLGDLIVIAICAVICGADGWVQVEQFARAKRKFFRKILDLHHGIPSHDTFGRVFSLLDPDAFERRFMAWTQSLADASGGFLVNIDGKALRRSFRHAWESSGMTHLVSAFVSANGMVFGQLAVAEKNNEIIAIPRLLELLDLKRAIITIDAMEYQKSIARQIVEGGGHYYLGLKKNQKGLHRKVKNLMNEAILEKFAGMEHDYFEEVDGEHDRIESAPGVVHAGGELAGSDGQSLGWTGDAGGGGVGA